MNTKNNQRTRITKKIFVNSLISLLTEGFSLESITITQICKKAELNRGTFYAHYSIPMDIMTEIENETFANFVGYIEEISKNDGIDKLVYLLKYIRANDNVYRILFSNKENTNFSSLILNSVFEEFSDLAQSIIDQRFTQYLYNYMILGSESILNNWIDSDYDLSEKEVAQMLFSLCKSVLKSFSYK
ncbi:TetR/AcrR family transcriptional regulator [Clostridium diolis]|uniref:TetR/AcrR family transcriptional regulator n=1 Tax=Clostridium diolis TaxID=223919 RepID=UPI003AF4B5D3